MAELFLDPNYEIPKEPGKYMKFQQGQNKVRILARPILGHVAWNNENKPIRVRMEEKMPMEHLRIENGEKKIKHFWAMPVWNYSEKLVQILEVTQSTIQRGIKSYAQNDDWGSPLEYDLTISKSGEKLLTEYEVMASPHKTLAKEVVDAWKVVQEKGFDLNKLFENGDPFGNGEVMATADDS